MDVKPIAFSRNIFFLKKLIFFVKLISRKKIMGVIGFASPKTYDWITFLYMTMLMVAEKHGTMLHLFAIFHLSSCSLLMILANIHLHSKVIFLYFWAIKLYLIFCEQQTLVIYLPSRFVEKRQHQSLLVNYVTGKLTHTSHNALVKQLLFWI